MMKALVVTNNSKVYEKHGVKMEVLFLEGASGLEILEKSRDLIHGGARLLSHPMAGSLKPNQTPFRSLLMEIPETSRDGTSQVGVSVDFQSLRLIENSIEAAKKFLMIKSVPKWPSAIREDFKTVDLSILDSAIK